jgi:hypothetical protein
MILCAKIIFVTACICVHCGQAEPIGASRKQPTAPARDSSALLPYVVASKGCSTWALPHNQARNVVKVEIWMRLWN